MLGGLERSVYRDSFYAYMRAAWPHIESAPYIDNWHVGAVCEHLQAVTLGQISKLLINIPPGCSKSLITCVFWPTWEWQRDPSVRWFFASYDQQLSTRDSVKCRTLLSSPWYQAMWPGRVMIKRDQDQKTYYETTAGGYRLATSVGGHGTGEHPDRVVFDDPHNVRKAESEVERQNVIDWWDLTMPTRGLSRGVRQVGIMQRLHHRDLAGHIISRGDFVLLCLPMRYEPNRMATTVLGWNDPRTIEGELLAPAQFPEEKIRSLEKSLGAYGVAGQLQQRPQPRGGGLFKPQWFNRRNRTAPREAVRVRAWDRAACLIAGTLIETLRGSVPIEDVRVGDLVLTRNGYRPVKWSGVSGFVNELIVARFANGAMIVGTVDHPVWTENRGWVELAAIRGSRYNDGRRILSCQNDVMIPRWLSSMGFGSDVLAENGISGGVYGTQDSADTVLTLCTESSGNTITGTYLTDAIYITRMKTGTTTTSLTWNASQGLNTTAFTTPSKDGIRRKLLRNITAELLGCGLNPQYIGNTPANYVGSLSAPVTSILNDCVGAVLNVANGHGMGIPRKNAVSVEGDIGDVLDRILVPRRVPTNCLFGPVLCAVLNLTDVKNANRTSAVAVNADRLRGVPVYDLQVDGDHEFFANGILVHNTNEGGCYTAGVLMAKDKDGTLYVEDCVHGQWEPNERNDRIIATAKKDRLRYGPKWEPTIVVEMERGSTGLESFQRLAARLVGYKIKEDRPTGSKDVRAEPWADQLAAGNVVICDNGGEPLWDIANYVTEHEQFKPDSKVKRLGKYKDQVDASSMACNWLANKSAEPAEARVIRFRTTDRNKPKHPRVVVSSYASLPNIDADQKTMLTVIHDPFTEKPEEARFLPSIPNLIDTHFSAFADLNPSDYQDAWEQPVEPYGKPPAELVIAREHGKAIWKALLKPQPTPELFIFVSPNGNRADAIAKAFMDVLRIPRDGLHYADSDNEEGKHKQPPANQHVYDVMRIARGAIL